MLKLKTGRNPIIPLSKPVFDREMARAAIDALRNEHFVLGDSVFKFEEEFAKYCDVDFAVSTSSGTTALTIALLALGVPKGQRVITTPASFIATSNSILHAGSKPAFADIDPLTYTIDPEMIRRAVSRRTKAIIPVHLYGYPADMNPIVDIADKHGVSVVEDACQAHGAFYEGRKVGCLGDVGCFSFYPSKNMTVAGDGGMLVTNSEKVATMAARLRDCGRKSKYIHDLVGYTARLNTVNAAVGRIQLRHLDRWNEKRRRNAQTYNRLLSDVDGLTLPPKGNGKTRPVYHLYTIKTKLRDRLKAWLQACGIECGVNYPLPIHLQPVYEEMFGFREGAYPRSEELSRTCLSIPMYPSLSRIESEFICEKIHGFFENQERKNST
jgi:perosamine synthetase